MRMINILKGERSEKGDKQMGHTALLVMGMQNDFIGEGAIFPFGSMRVARLLETVNKTIEKANRRDMEIVYIVNEYSHIDWIGNWKRNGAAQEGTEGAGLDVRIQLVNDVIFSKRFNNAFSNDRLIVHLKQLRVRHIIIAGVFAGTCVYRTALDAKRRGYQVTVIRDGIEDRTVKEKEEKLLQLQKNGISVSLYEDIRWPHEKGS